MHSICISTHGSDILNYIASTFKLVCCVQGFVFKQYLQHSNYSVLILIVHDLENIMDESTQQQCIDGDIITQEDSQTTITTTSQSLRQDVPPSSSIMCQCMPAEDTCAFRIIRIN